MERTRRTAAGVLESAREGTAGATWLCLAGVVASLTLRLLYLVQVWRVDLSEHPVVNSDEGTVGLMARHILTGARPLFFYGQYYLGALEAYLVAVVFHLFGQSMITLRLVPTLFTLTWIPLTAAVARRLYGPRAALLAAVLVALPSQFVFEWGCKARGGFAEHVAFMLLLLYLTMLLQERVTAGRLVTLGFIAGLSLWVNQLALAYVPILGYALLSWVPLRRRQLAAVAVAGLIGASPLIYGNIVNPLGTVRSLALHAKSSKHFEKLLTSVEPDEERDYRGVPLFQVVGMQARRDGSWSVSGTITAIFLLVGGCATGLRAYGFGRSNLLRFRRHLILFGFVAATLVVGGGGFAGRTLGRYQLLLYPLLCILSVGWLEESRPRWAVPLVGLLAFGQMIQLALPAPSDGRTPREVIDDALLQHDLHYGYGPGAMYDLVFQSGERVIIEPLEHSRSPRYQSLVGGADRVFYIYRDDQRRKRNHQAFVKYLSAAGATYKQFDVNEYHVLYDVEPASVISLQMLTKAHLKL
ncbi:MAG: glycosyltransferase family 39 protein [Candidatus Binatia bacterium]